MSWKQTIRKKPTWKDSIMRAKPITPDDMKSEVIKLLMPEIKEKTSWKNTLSIKPLNGKDGANGKDGKNGTKGTKGDQGPQGLPGKPITAGNAAHQPGEHHEHFATRRLPALQCHQPHSNAARRQGIELRALPPAAVWHCTLIGQRGEF